MSQDQYPCPSNVVSKTQGLQTLDLLPLQRDLIQSNVKTKADFRNPHLTCLNMAVLTGNFLRNSYSFLPTAIEQKFSMGIMRSSKKMVNANVQQLFSNL